MGRFWALSRVRYLIDMLYLEKPFSAVFHLLTMTLYNGIMVKNT